ncbi:unnamed protein product, partial [Urochloa humidicola]
AYIPVSTEDGAASRFLSPLDPLQTFSDAGRARRQAWSIAATPISAVGEWILQLSPRSMGTVAGSVGAARSLAAGSGVVLGSRHGGTKFGLPIPSRRSLPACDSPKGGKSGDRISQKVAKAVAAAHSSLPLLRRAEHVALSPAPPCSSSGTTPCLPSLTTA